MREEKKLKRGSNEDKELARGFVRDILYKNYSTLNLPRTYVPLRSTIMHIAHNASDNIRQALTDRLIEGEIRTFAKTIGLRAKRGAGKINKRIKVEWIDLEKEQPTSLKKVIFCKNDGEVDCGYYNYHFDTNTAKYWMPLPIVPVYRVLPEATNEKIKEEFINLKIVDKE